MRTTLTHRARSLIFVALVTAGFGATACAGSDPQSSSAVALPTPIEVATATPERTTEVEAQASPTPEPTTEVEAQASPTPERTTEVEAQASPTPERTTEVEAQASPTAEPTAEVEVDPAGEQSDEADILDGVLTDVVADAQGGRAFFDGVIDSETDLEDLVADAWGDGGLGLHRGHAQVENVLEAFLGINHDAMHDYMDQGLNLAATAEALAKDPEALIESLTYSYIPFVDQAVDNGVIAEEEADSWIQALRVEFTDRVYWDGVSAS